MRTDLASLIAILGMAVATYVTRAGGLWLTQRFRPSPRVAACLHHTPGAVLIAIVTPTILAGGLPAALAGAVTVLVAVRSGSVLVATAAGIAAVWALRAFA